MAVLIFSEVTVVPQNKGHIGPGPAVLFTVLLNLDLSLALLVSRGPESHILARARLVHNMIVSTI